MRGIVRPCRSHLGPELHARWQAHLCGLCLTLRDVAGQAERVLTGYDVLLLSVLVEAQAGKVETTTAAPCPLRGFHRATVVSSTSTAARLAAAGAVVSAAAGLVDKIDDDDLPRPARGAARRVASRLTSSGSVLAESVGLDPSVVLSAPAVSASAEAVEGATLEALLAPTGEAVASLFRHTASVAGKPANAVPLAEAGRAFGALVHLLDAVEDRQADAAAGRFNPLTSTGTDAATARHLAEELVARVGGALARTDLVDRALVDVLLGRELTAAVTRVLPGACACAPVALVPQQRTGTSSVLSVWALMAQAVIIGGSWGGGGRRRRFGRRSDPYGYESGYRTSGPSCGQCLACNCCANLACNACCCGCNS
jgi:hypothetical protein